jgi:hypothetical protein
MLAGQQEAETHVGAQDADRRYMSVAGPVMRSRTHPTAPPAHRGPASKLRLPPFTSRAAGPDPADPVTTALDDVSRRVLSAAALQPFVASRAKRSRAPR